MYLRYFFPQPCPTPTRVTRMSDIILRWHLKEESPLSASDSVSWLSAAASHVLLSGVIWRYGKLLFAPVDVAVVKREMRNLREQHTSTYQKQQ